MLRYKRSTASKPTLRQVLYLLSGKDWTWLDDVSDMVETTLQGFWMQHDESLIALHLTHIGMGRPWAYWRYTLEIDPPRDAEGDPNRYSQAKYIDTHKLRRADDPPVRKHYPGDACHLPYTVALAYSNFDWWPNVRDQIADVLKAAGHVSLAKRVFTEERTRELADSVMAYQSVEQRLRDAGITASLWVDSKAAEAWIQALA